MTFLIAIAAFMLMILVLFFLSRKSDEASMVEKLNAEKAEELAAMLSKFAMGLLTGKYCGLVCNKISEIEKNFRRDLEKLMLELLRKESGQIGFRAEELAAKITEPVQTYLLGFITTPYCETCEERSLTFADRVKEIILEILKNENCIES